jgi:hypothetical protein
MNKTLKALEKGMKAGVKAAREFSEPKQYKVIGKIVICSHCSNDMFTNFTWFALRIGFGLQCTQCTHVEYFVKEPEKI